MARDLKYHINLDERGEFYADVRRGEKTILEIKGNEMFEDGFMKNKDDVRGLQQYLHATGLAAWDEEVVKG